MHGGARRSGAPRGNGNAKRHGLFTSDAIAEREQARVLLDEAQELLQKLR